MRIWIFRRTRRAAPGRRAYLAQREAARALVQARLAYWGPMGDFHWNRVSIKNHRSIWGSCSRKGNLNFNYRLVLLPPEIADYVIMHELCHLKEPNHSRRFWVLVEHFIPQWRQYRALLRGYSVR